MKRAVVIFIILSMPFLLMMTVSAVDRQMFQEESETLSDSIPDELKDEMAQLGVGEPNVSEIGSLSLNSFIGSMLKMLYDNASSPLSACAMIAAVLILTSMIESYTFSLRYTETKEVMMTVTTLLIVTVITPPLYQLINRCTEVIRITADIMLTYVPIMIGIMAFSGHIISSSGYYATVMAASQGIARLSASVFSPMMSIYLALAVSAGLSDRVRITGICEIFQRLIKWCLTFSMALFSAVLSLQSIAASSADTVASRAVRLTLSSFIPLVGSSISEAYKTIQSSVDLLRSGMGVYVILAVIVAFLPLILRVLLWSAGIAVSKLCAETFGVSSPAVLLTAVGNLLSVLLGVLICVAAVFIISTGALMAIGGAS